MQKTDVASNRHDRWRSRIHGLVLHASGVHVLYVCVSVCVLHGCARFRCPNARAHALAISVDEYRARSLVRLQLSTHNDITINKKNPYQFRVKGGTPKFVHSKSALVCCVVYARLGRSCSQRARSHARTLTARSDTHRDLKFNAQTMRWE